MALGFVRSTVKLLTCGRGITPVRGFHQLSCLLLYRLALMLVFGLCVWKWTSSVTSLDPNQNCSIGLCSGAVLYGHKAVQCDKCEMWIHNKCSLITESEFDSVENTNCTWICPKCNFFNFSDSFFADQLNLENGNRSDPLANGSGTKASQTNLSLD